MSTSPSWKLLAFVTMLCSTQARAALELQKHKLGCASPGDCPAAVAKLIIADDKGAETRCTGFLVGPKLLATSRHCVPGSLLLAGANCEGRIVAQFPAIDQRPAEIVSCKTVLAFSPAPRPSVIDAQDYAFLELGQELARKPLRVSHKGASKGKKLAAWKARGPVNSQVAKEQCEVIQRSLLFPFASTSTSATLTMKNCSSDGGDSGAPLLNERGEVVAILEGASNQKSFEYFTQKYGFKSGQKVVKASNFACICLPSEETKNCKPAPECVTEIPDSGFLLEGGRLFEKAVEDSRRCLEQGFGSQTGAQLPPGLGLRWVPSFLLDDEFQELRLRPDHYHFGWYPQCIENQEEFAKGSQQFHQAGKFSHYMLIKGKGLCALRFALSSHLEINRAELDACRPADYLLSYGVEATETGQKTVMRLGALDSNLTLLAWREGELPACSAAAGSGATQ